MKVFTGKLVIDLSTVVKTGNEKEMIEEAHQGLTSELLDEIQLLLGANGYWADSLGGTLEEGNNQSEARIKTIISKTDEAKKDINKIYDKVNIEKNTFSFKID
ncbi:hypothetical protein [Bacillus sp. J37]|uniref:hypothetical protein n=1 Tax=Bacillus sp. J37 TaxID=935837 RepID=UPI00047CA3B1|nr:hypothetical protein [Bacillus sp. J37]